MQQHLMKQDRSSRLPSREELCNSQFQQLLLATEGQCRIQTIRYLRANYLKGVILTTLLAVTLVGLLCLKYFKKLRAFVFYDTVSQQQLERITHVYVSGTDKAEQISKVEAIQYENERRWLFQFKKLRYQLFQDRWLPLGLPYMRDIDRLKSDTFLSEGLASESSAQKVRVYGRNEHNVQVPSYPQYVFDTMTQPFFLFQYFVSLIYALQNVMLFSVLMIAFGFITTTVNYILLRRSYNKIKETAEKRFMVQVLRNGTFHQLQNTEILPGDLFVPCQEIPCDGIVVRGELFVDEVSLTGETVPIAKFAVADGRKVNNKQHWLWEGSKLETMKGNSLALAVSVGYASRRGRIIRKILTRVGQQPQFFRKIIYFQIEVLFVSILLYLFTLPNLLSLNVDGYLVIFRFCDFITYSFPAPYPIFFNLAYSFCLVRLNQAGILGTQPEKTVQGSRLKTMCFDKTGTLTLNRMQVCKLYSAQGPNNFNQITGSSPDKALIANCLATCNSVELINGEVKGDEIDLRLFEFFKGRLQTSDKSGVVRQVIIYGRALEVIKINQYESQFQSMSVLVREPQAGRCYVFVKGSPEMIHNYSTTKFAGFQEFIKKMSFSGYRSIGFGFKEVQPQEIESMLHGTREEFLKHTKLLGIVTFVNQLKDDAISTIETLAEAGITTKIITGDNIFLGVQTAFATGMIESQARVLVVEGSKYNLASKELQAFELTRSQDGTFNEKLRLFKDFSYESDDEVVYAIDNDFIVLKGEDFLHDSVKVFARISPENKALIVKKHKQKEQQAVNSRQGIKKLLGDCSFKVGMVGDGANDLIAIKQADLGIGISSSDAIYSASFAVTQLGQIAEVLIESKNSERQINEMAKYYGITQFLSIVFTLIMTNDYAYMTSLELIYKNFFNTLLITLLYGRSKPAAKLSKQMPSSNFLDLENHLIFWGNTLICSLGLIISYAYYSHTDDFQRNSHQEARFPDGWFSETKTSTINFIAANIVFIVLPVFIYQSAPWKRPLWTNRGLLMLLIANVVVLGVICYTTESLGSLTIQPIGKKEVTVVIVIMVATCLLCGVMNYLLQWFYLRRQRFRRQGAQEHALVEY